MLGIGDPELDGQKSEQPRACKARSTCMSQKHGNIRSSVAHYMECTRIWKETHGYTERIKCMGVRYVQNGVLYETYQTHRYMLIVNVSGWRQQQLELSRRRQALQHESHAVKVAVGGGSDQRRVAELSYEGRQKGRNTQHYTIMKFQNTSLTKHHGCMANLIGIGIFARPHTSTCRVWETAFQQHWWHSVNHGSDSRTKEHIKTINESCLSIHKGNLKT